MLTKLNQQVMILPCCETKFFALLRCNWWRLSPVQVPAERSIALYQCLRHADHLVVSPSSQDNRVDVPAVVDLAAVGHAPVAEELVRVRVGARVDVLDRPDPGRGKPRDHIAGEIEHEMPLARARAE